MCFSATASFTASISLAILGILSYKEANRTGTRILAFSPLIFALQQASEGFLWLALTHPTWQWIQAYATYFFLFCALAWWPLWIPLALTVVEPNRLKRHILIGLFLFGSIFSAYMLFCLGSYGATASIATCATDACHMYYAFEIPGSSYLLLGALYTIPAVLPFFVSSIWGMNALGGAISISYLISYSFYRMHFLSVWCFFSAVLSVMIFTIIKRISSQETSNL